MEGRSSGPVRRLEGVRRPGAGGGGGGGGGRPGAESVGLKVRLRSRRAGRGRLRAPRRRFGLCGPSRFVADAPASPGSRGRPSRASPDPMTHSSRRKSWADRPGWQGPEPPARKAGERLGREGPGEKGPASGGLRRGASDAKSRSSPRPRGLVSLRECRREASRWLDARGGSAAGLVATRHGVAAVQR